MSDLMANVKSIAEDPLVIALALLFLGVIATRLLLRNYRAYQNITRGVFFLLVTIALLHGQIVPYQPIHPTGSSLRNSIQIILEIGWWVYGAWLLAAGPRPATHPARLHQQCSREAGRRGLHRAERPREGCGGPGMLPVRSRSASDIASVLSPMGPTPAS